MIELNPTVSSQPRDINDKEQVVGYYGAPVFHAFYWTAESGMVQLNGLPSSSVNRAVAVNAKGQIAGMSWASSGSHAVVWSPA
jgi:uncharacterized membrane protein